MVAVRAVDFECPNAAAATDDSYRALVIRLVRDNWAAESANLSLPAHAHVLPLELAPTMTDRAALAQYWADECRHAMMFAALLDDLGAAPAPGEYDADRPVEILNLPIATWGQFGLFQLFADTAGCIHLSDYRSCTYLPLRSAAKVILRDEARHVRLGMHNLRTAIATEDGYLDVVDALPRWYEAALELFGRIDRPSRRDAAMVDAGLRRSTNAELRRRYVGRIASSLRSLGLPVPGTQEPPR